MDDVTRRIFLVLLSVFMAMPRVAEAQSLPSPILWDDGSNILWDDGSEILWDTGGSFGGGFGIFRPR
jgi:hypothetical protein